MKIQTVVATILFIFILPSLACSRSKKEAPSASVQMPVVAGAFYPADPSVLKSQVDQFISKVPQKTFDGTIVGLIAPHAGYQYSGSIAGAAFRQIKGKKYSRVVVIAPSHRVSFDGAVLSNKEKYRTPLGDIPIDVKSVKKIVTENTWALPDQKPYEVEHSLEVELPFLQRVLKDFSLVPVIIGTKDADKLDAIALALDRTFPSEDTLFVASTDLSHYLPYKEAVDIDRKTISAICEKDAEVYEKSVVGGGAELCGSQPVYVLKKIAERRGGKFHLIEYANSGDTSGDKSRVVGYAAIVAVVAPQLGDKQKGELLKLARATLVAHVTGKTLPPLPDDPLLKKPGAAFVTLKKGGNLRGCIGEVVARKPLGSVIQEMAVSAASYDPRFRPVRPDELKDISIEVSVLTPPEALSDPGAVRVGTDGLIIEKGSNRGLLLPQVPSEFGWTREQFLDALCDKTGLPRGSWKDAKLMRFQAIVFGEAR